MPHMPATLFKGGKPKEPEGKRVYIEYVTTRRRYLLSMAQANRLLYVQPGWAGEGQHYAILSVAYSENGSVSESFQEVPTKLVHDSTYIKDPYLHDVPLEDRLGRPKTLPIDITPHGIKFLLDRQDMPDFDSLEAIDAHFRQFIDLEKEE
jgi:hypothetical protein